MGRIPRLLGVVWFGSNHFPPCKLEWQTLPTTPREKDFFKIFSEGAYNYFGFNPHRACTILSEDLSDFLIADAQRRVLKGCRTGIRTQDLL